MTFAEYWNGDPRLVIAYRKAHELQIKQRNEEMWLQGLYNFNAFSTALSNMHFDGKHHKPNKYIEKPIDLFEKDDKQKEIDAEKERKKIIENFNRLKMAWDKEQKGK